MDPLTPLDTFAGSSSGRANMRRKPRATMILARIPTMSMMSRKARSASSMTTSTTASRKSFRRSFEDLGEDQLAEVIAFCWVGEGTYETGDWDEAMEEAQSLVSESVARGDQRTDGSADACLGARIGPRGIRPQLRRDRRSHLSRTDRRRPFPRAAEIAVNSKTADRAAARTKLRSSACLSARATFGATLFWIVMCGRHPPLSWALRRP